MPFEFGAPVTQFHTSDTGDFENVVLPEGRYTLEFRASERDAIMVEGIVVSDGKDTEVTVPPLSSVGRMTIELVELVDAHQRLQLVDHRRGCRHQSCRYIAYCGPLLARNCRRTTETVPATLCSR